jgi:TolB-like protein/DNA-binding winged helix-turn-helix (wHTH) protein/Tfp pilus assembly protein PilF
MQIPSRSRKVLRFEAFEADLSSGELQKHGIKIRLQAQPFQILVLLLERPGEVVTREELRTKLWHSDTFVDFDVGLNSAILRLRSALGDSAEKPKFVETLPRRGYRFISAVHNGGPETAPTLVAGDSVLVSAVEQTMPTREFTAARRPSSKLRISITAFAVGLALLLGFNVLDVRNRLLGRRGLPAIHSIAVLPLENLSGDPAQEFLADGMTDALITDLAQISVLRVISRTSVMRYKGTKKSLPEISRELNVDAIVEGSVVRSGNRVRITGQLIHPATDRHLWAKNYESELSNVVTLQSDVAREIAAEIQAKLSPQEQVRLAKTRAVSPAAYEACLQGRFHLNRWSVQEANNALQYFQQALAIDPSYAQAYSGLSDCYRTLAFVGGFKRESWEKAKAEATRALALDDSLAEAHRSLASVRLWHDWDLAESEREIQRALQLNPGEAETYRVYGVMLTTRGRLNEAMAMLERAQELDPLSPVIAVDAARAYYFARRNDQAMELARKAIELDPAFALAHRFVGDAYEAQGKFPEAIAELKQAANLSPGNLSYVGMLGRSYALAGNRREARRTIAKLTEVSKTREDVPLQLALIYGALGENDQAFRWLERDFENRTGNLLALSVAPWFDPLRSDPRFADLVRRVGLVVKQAENAANKISK